MSNVRRTIISCQNLNDTSIEDYSTRLLTVLEEWGTGWWLWKKKHSRHAIYARLKFDSGYCWRTLDGQEVQPWTGILLGKCWEQADAAKKIQAALDKVIQDG